MMLQRKIATPEKPEGPKPPSRGPIETITSPYDRFTPRQGYPDTPALRQLRYLHHIMCIGKWTHYEIKSYTSVIIPT